VQLRASSHPEFDAWRWSQYWVPLESVVEFKRNVYQLALGELEPFLNADRLRHPALGRRGRRPAGGSDAKNAPTVKPEAV